MISSILIKYEYSLSRPIWPLDGILTGTTTSVQSVPGNNGNDKVLHTLQSSKIWASQPDAV